MKHFWAVALASVAALTFVVLAKKEDDEKEKARLANPVLELNDLHEVNAQALTNLKKVEGANDELYSVINLSKQRVLGQYMFSLNGDFTLRAIVVDERDALFDISGVYTSEGTCFERWGSTSEIHQVQEGQYYVGWLKDNVHYSLFGQETTFDAFLQVFNSVK